MKDFDENAVTLAIGDGGNDVSMIMEANIGIGIHGEEGMSAAQASDFSIGEFHILKKLLFIHGRTNLMRISKMILYFFFKNFVFTTIQFYYAIYCLGSGQTFVDDWYITCYNLIFTALPLCISALTDSDINLNGGKVTRKNLALLYRENRDKYRIFSIKNFSLSILKGIIFSIIIFFLCLIRQILSLKGHYGSIWYLSLKSYTCILVVVSANLLINNNFITLYLPLSILITTFLLYIIFLILNHYGILFEFNSKASIFSSLSSPVFLLSVFFISCLIIIIDYSLKLFNFLFSHSLSSKIIFEKSLRKSKQFSYTFMRNNICSKSYSNININSNSYRNRFNRSSNYINRNLKIRKRSKIRSSLPNKEISSNYLIKSKNYILKTLNNNSSNNESPSNKNDHNNFKLKFRNKNQIFNYKDNNHKDEKLKS
jgi:magnesium-transporting ATPase (P-type)